MNALQKLLRFALDLLFPRRAVCVGCGSAVGCDEDWLCADCAERLCGHRIGARPLPGRFPIFRRAHAYAYRGPVPGIVHALKYDSVSGLAKRMASDMAAACAELEFSDAPLVVPVPMHAFRKRRRGYNQAELLSKEVAGALGFPHANALRKLRGTRQQAALPRERRAENLRGSVGVRLPVAGRAVLLVDDVYTTGATATACAEALIRADCR
ncbi:MAG: ComF family protein, partial [Clostridiales bacterium]|nr:ComF family protein [Clostridiales bacterium]